MRKLIVCNIVSLDGFFSGPGGTNLGGGIDAWSEEVDRSVPRY